MLAPAGGVIFYGELLGTGVEGTRRAGAAALELRAHAKNVPVSCTSDPPPQPGCDILFAEINPPAECKQDAAACLVRLLRRAAGFVDVVVLVFTLLSFSEAAVSACIKVFPTSVCC